MASKTKAANRSTALAVSVIAAAALGIYGYRGWQRAQAVGRASVDWSSLAQCLVGAPLAAGARPSARLRNIELARATAGRPSAWPGRCKQYARATLADLAALPRGAPFDRARDALSRAAAELERGTVPAEADALWEAMGTAGVVHRAGGSAPAPPAPETPLTAGALAKMVRSAVTGPVSAKLPSGDVRLLFVGPAAVGCVVGAGAGADDALVEAHCQPLPGVRPREGTFEVVDAEVGAPIYVIARTRLGARLIGPDGRELLNEPRLGAYARRDGTVFALVYAATGPRLVRLRSGSEPESLPLAPSSRGAAFEPVLVSNRVIYAAQSARAPHPDEPEEEGEEEEENEGRPEVDSRIFSWTLPEQGALGAEVAVGQVPSEVIHIRACETAEATLLVADGPEEHDQVPVHVFFGGPDGWRGPATGLVSIVASTLTCSGNVATFVWVEAAQSRAPGAYRVARLRCAPDGCTSSSADVVGAGTDPLLAELGGRTLLVGRDPVDHTLMMRMAPLAELARAPSHVLVDVARFGGADVIAQSLFARDSAALLVLRTPSDVRGIRIDSRGELRSIVAR